MEFNEKLQELRKQKGFTQEELAEMLFVSRTAISKWESGRGYPNIDSLKRISKLFSVSIDELLSGEELLNIAEEDNKSKENYFRDLVFGVLDIGLIMLCFLPFFAQKSDGFIQEVSLLNLTEISSYLKVLYTLVVFCAVLLGVLTLILQNCNQRFWLKLKSRLSVLFSIFAVILFVLSLQPYAAIFLFLLLIIKIMILIKWR